MINLTRLAGAWDVRGGDPGGILAMSVGESVLLDILEIELRKSAPQLAPLPRPHRANSIFEENNEPVPTVRDLDGAWGTDGTASVIAEAKCWTANSFDGVTVTDSNRLELAARTASELEKELQAEHWTTNTKILLPVRGDSWETDQLTVERWLTVWRPASLSDDLNPISTVSSCVTLGEAGWVETDVRILSASLWVREQLALGQEEVTLHRTEAVLGRMSALTA